MLSILVIGWGLGCAHHWLNWRQAATASRRLVADLIAASQRPDVEEIVVANMPFRVHGGSVAGDFDAALRVQGGKPVRVRAVCYVSYPSADSPAADSMEASGAELRFRGVESEAQPTRVPARGREGKLVGATEDPEAQGIVPRSEAPGVDGGPVGEVNAPPPRVASAMTRSLASAPHVSLRADSTATEVLLRIPERPFSHYVGPKPPPGESHVDTPFGSVFFDARETVRIRVPTGPGLRRTVYAWIAGRLVPAAGPTAVKLRSFHATRRSRRFRTAG